MAEFQARVKIEEMKVTKDSHRCANLPKFLEISGVKWGSVLPGHSLKSIYPKTSKSFEITPFDNVTDFNVVATHWRVYKLNGAK
jgi:hypothetical protein